MLSDVGGGGLTSVLDVQSLLKKTECVLWPEIMLIIYYWQETFLLTLTSDNKAILQWHHCIVCGLNRTIERVVNWTWRALACFGLISFTHMHGAVVFTKQVDCKIRTKKSFLKKTFRDIFVLFCDVLNCTSKVKRVEKFRT